MNRKNRISMKNKANMMTVPACAAIGIILAFLLSACAGPAESGTAGFSSGTSVPGTSASVTAVSSAPVSVTTVSSASVPGTSASVTTVSSNSVSTVSEALARIRQSLGLTPAEVETLLGADFETVEAGVDGQNLGYRYQRLGFTIAFDRRNPDGQVRAYQASIESTAIDLHGTRLGMPFSEIMAIRGQTAIRSSFVKDDNSPSHYIAYSRDGLNTVYDSGSPPGQPPVAKSITVTRAGG